MITDSSTNPALPPPSTARLPERELLALVLGRDVVQVPDDGAAGTDGRTLLPLPAQLFFLSFLMLFVELALIRWSGALVIYLSYFSNFVLLGSFLGIGIGFLRARARVNLFPWAPVALALLIFFVRVFPVQVDRSGNQLLYFGYGTFHASGPPTWVTLPVVFLAVAAVMAMIGEGVVPGVYSVRATGCLSPAYRWQPGRDGGQNITRAAVAAVAAMGSPVTCRSGWSLRPDRARR